MNRRWLAILWLTVTIAGLGAGLWLSFRGPPQQRPPLPGLTNLSRPQVRRIRIRRGANLIVITRTGKSAHWYLDQPVRAPVDGPHLQAMLSLLGQRAQRRYAPGAISGSTTGLEHPGLVVQFNQNAPIRIGGQGPSRGSRYIATPHDLLIADLPDLGGLQWGWAHWISPALVPPDRQLSRIVLPDFTLMRPNGRWQAQPRHKRAPEAVAATATAWQRARALSVVPANTSKQRIARITLDFKHGPPRHFDLIERQPNLILRDPALDVAYHLAGNRVAPLLDIKHPGL